MLMGRAHCTLAVRGLDCPAEVLPLRVALEDLPGVLGLTFDPPEGTVTVEYDTAKTNPAALVGQVDERARMKAKIVPDAPTPEDPHQPRPQGMRWLVLLVSGLALGLGVAAERLVASSWLAPFAFLLAILAGGLPLVPKAWLALVSLRLDIHVLMILAIVGAMALGQWDEAATVAFLFGLSEALEALSLERAKRAIRSLLEVAPETAERIGANGQIEVVDARHVAPGDRVRVRAGERVPVDGTITHGRSSLDQRAITGESVPVSRGPGEVVFAGTVNQEGTLEIEATRALGDSLVSRIVERVRAAQAGRAPTERTIERFAAWYTPTVIALAVTIMLAAPLVQLASGADPQWADWIYRGLVVLVVSCPCALVIGTPVAVVSALASAARHGVLIKGGQHLEMFGRLRVLAFDKTGTLTTGTPDVVEVGSAVGHADEDVLRIAAALGDRGNHVVGLAIARHARGLRLEVPEAHDYQAVPGLGATGRVGPSRYHLGSHRYLDESGLCRPDFHVSLEGAENGVGTAVALTGVNGPLGWIRLADRARPEAGAVLVQLRALGIESVMLSGDNPKTAGAMADELGIIDHRASLLPDEKARAVLDLDARRGPTGMVGDGVNDAPALAAARVSVAMRGISSGAALETADIVLMADDLRPLPWLVRHSRRTLGRIRQNIILAIGSKALVLLLAVLGLATLWMAIAADVGVSLLVVANALRLLKTKDIEE